MRNKFLILVFLFLLSVPVFAQETPTDACVVVVKDGVVTLPGDMALCTDEALAQIVDHIKEQTGADGSTAVAGESPKLVSQMTSGVWDVKMYEGITPDMVQSLKELGSFAPNAEKGKTLFNEDWQGISKKNLGEFPEVQESAFCEGGDQCLFIAPVGHFRYASGDGSIPGIGESCSQTDNIGCVRIVQNFGTVDTALEANLKSNYSFAGRYWNDGLLVDAEGKVIPEKGRATPYFWDAISSYASNVMTNADSKLNPAGVVNAGGNCSSAKGCDGVRIAIYGMSGNQLLFSAIAVYIKP